VISRIDEKLRYSTDPAATLVCEEAAEEAAAPSDEGDPWGWCASRAEDKESRWREGCAS
jgi:hypothetical protein